MCCDCECRPLGFLIGLPFALLAFLLSILGLLLWIIGTILSFICPCCICVAAILNMALGLIKAPLSVMKWFASKIPC